MADPRYVRLADHLSDSIVADIAGGSGWSISGRDVKEFPKEADQGRFVRSRLVLGLLEPAGKAEHDELQAANKAMADAAPRPEGPQPINEAAVQQAAAAANARLISGGGSEDDEEDGEDDDSDEPDDIDDLNSDGLNDRLRAAGLPTNGNMEVRRARLREAS